MKHFDGNWLRTSLFGSKTWHLRKKLRNIHKYFFSQHVWKGSNPEKIFDLMETTFCQTSDLGQILPKYSLLKISDIELNYAFLVLWSIFEEINWKPLLHQIVTVSEWSQELLRKLFFLNKFENGKFLRKIMIWWKHLFWSNQWNGTNIDENGFLPQMTHILLNYAFLVFWQKNSLFGSKTWLSQK